MKLYLELAVNNVPVGALYALQALGIVLIYRTTKVFTFAQAGLGVFAAFFTAYCGQEGFPLWIAAILGVSSSVLFSYAIEFTIRFTRGAIQRTVVTLGWLLALQGISAYCFTLKGTAADVVSTNSPFDSLKSFIITVSWLGLASIAVTLAIGIGLALFLARTSLGTAMRGVSDDPEAARLLGLPVRRVALLSWVVGGSLAGLSGILAAPSQGLDQSQLLVFTIEAIAVALVARLESLPVAIAAGFALAVVEPLLAQATGIQDGVPEATAFVVALASLVLRRRTGRADTGGAGLPPAPVKVLPTGPRAAGIAAGIVILVLAVPYAFGHDGNNNLAGLGVYAMATLSLVVLSGVVGQISICTGAFMGVGGLSAAAAASHGVPYLLALVIGAVAASIVAALVALPAIRLEPLELAIATISLSFAADRFIFAPSRTSVMSADGGRTISLPHFLSDSPAPAGSGTAGGRHLVWFIFGLFVLVGFAAANLRRGRTGAALTALRSSRAATAAMGFSVASAKLRGFATSGLIAGLAGGLLISHLLSLQAVGGATQPYDTTTSITLLAYAVIGGLGNIPSALVGGALFQLPTILVNSGSPNPDVTALTTVFSGVILIVVVVLLPDGIVDGAARLVRRARPNGPGALGPVRTADPAFDLVGVG